MFLLLNIYVSSLIGFYTFSMKNDSILSVKQIIRFIAWTNFNITSGLTYEMSFEMFINLLLNRNIFSIAINCIAKYLIEYTISLKSYKILHRFMEYTSSEKKKNIKTHVFGISKSCDTLKCKYVKICVFLLFKFQNSLWSIKMKRKK